MGMTKEQRDACEALADKYADKDWPRKSDWDRQDRYETRMKYEVRYEVEQAFEDGFQAAQSPEMLMLNPLVKGLVEKLESINFRRRRRDTSMLASSPPQNAQVYELEVIIEEALAPFKRGEK